MKKIQLILIFLCFSVSYGQSIIKNKNSELYKSAPDWAKLMYSENPNVNVVDRLYAEYFKNNKYSKSYHSQYYKRWRRAINPYLNNEGYFDKAKKTKLVANLPTLQNVQENSKKVGNNWTALGPFRNPKIGGTAKSGSQANVFTIGRCEASPNVMYCGTQPGEVYKSTDGANTWVNVSKTLVTAYTPDVVTANAGINALAVHPSNPDIVYIGSGSQVFKTSNSGTTWDLVFDSQIYIGGYIEDPSEIFIHTTNPQIVMVATQDGIYRTSNGGSNWNRVLTNDCYDIKAKPGNPDILYTIRNNNSTNTHQFLISTDAGVTWTPQTSGWYNSTNASRSVGGARIAVSAADSNRVYAFLIGDSKPGDNGFIGIYRSNDGGVSWTNTMGFDGAPYTANTHPNLISSNPVTDPNFGFNQGFYNCAIMASNTNADEILVGGIGMWRSNNGGQSFQCKYNYVCQDYSLMHVDQQDFRAFGNEYWATNDGGIFKSNDMFNTQPEFKMDGVRAVDFWGFGSGWNRDILIGGTFHNDTDAYAEGFPDGDFINLNSGEPQSGYVSPSGQSRVYGTGIGSKILPQTITGPVISAPFEVYSNGETLNESPWFAESSELEFHPSCFNYMYKGYQNKLFKSIDGGASFSAVYTANANTKVLGIEISRKNTNTMYIVIRPNSGNGYIVKTTNDWATNSTIILPAGGNNLAIISIDPENDQIIWLAYPRGADGSTVFKSINGGTTWSNQTSAELNAQNIQAMTTIGGTNGGVYIATNATVYYKNNSMTNWAYDNVNLPTTIGSIGMRPFYRDGKIRIASLGKGIWESKLYETPTRPVAKIMVDKLTANLCNSIFYFDDYSMLNHTNATWAWTFQDANIGTSSIRNPQVSFNTIGNHLVTLTVTNANGLSSTDTLIVNNTISTNATINQNFEVAFLPQGWFQETNGGYNWSYNNTVGGFGQSTKCMIADNYNINQPGLFADMIAPINMSTISAANASLTFDVAYSFYTNTSQDALQVLVSSNCGVNYTTVYDKAGMQLATVPSSQNIFVPTATQWRTETVNLSSYIGNPSVLIKFRNINQYGQPIYVDNIMLNGTTLATNNFNLITPIVFPNPITSIGFITVKGNDDSKIKFNLFSIEGKLIDTIFTNFNTPIPIDNYNLSQGTYLYKIISEDKILTGKLIVSDRR
jgi:photosystem II stability/assembly factor-like uncharacterized protein